MRLEESSNRFWYFKSIAVYNRLLARQFQLALFPGLYAQLLLFASDKSWARGLETRLSFGVVSAYYPWLKIGHFIPPV